MTKYKVGDHIEEVNTCGDVEDTGVVFWVDNSKGRVWATFDSTGNRESYFYDTSPEYRVKVQEQQPEVITDEKPHALNSVQELAIIRDIRVGMRDCSKPVVYFTVDVLSGSSLQIIEDIPAFIRETGCYKLEDLEGKACVVEKTSDWMIKYVCLKK